MAKTLPKALESRKWKPGQSGNPAGKPKGTPNIADMLKRFGEFQTPEVLIAKVRAMFPNDIRGTKPLTLSEALWLSAYMRGIEGEGWAFQLIADRTEGKVTQPIAVENKTVTIGVGAPGIGLEEM